MKPIYCISGFGADEKVFSKLTFPGYDIHYIKWNIPEKNETPDAYAKRLIEQIHHNKPILIGLSFGGMMCIEIARQFPVEKIILISSIKSSHEKPLWMKLSQRLKMNKIFPMRSFRLIEPIEDYNLGLETIEEKEIVHAYRRSINQYYTDWAIDVILNWKNDWVPKNLFHIHGKKDRIFPFKNVSADYLVASGGHFMIMNRFAEVNECINSALQKELNYQNDAL
jgi:pimeloyl-ACP methyl ester carboxylesterase